MSHNKVRNRIGFRSAGLRRFAYATPGAAILALM